MENNKKITNSYINDFKTFFENTEYINQSNRTKNNKLFKILYEKTYSKKSYKKLSIELIKKKYEWLPLFNNIKEKMELIPESFKDSTETTFNKFVNLYNRIYNMLNEIYFVIIQNIENNTYNKINFILLFDNNSDYNIENIYSLIENTDRTLINKNDTLTSYYTNMINKQSTKKSTTNKNESKHNFSLTSNGKILIKIRQLRLTTTKNELNISTYYYNLKKIVQSLVLLKYAIKYYYLSKDYIANTKLRTNLLVLIKTLQGTISRSNELSNKDKEENRVSIRSAFKRRFLNTENNENNFVHNYNSSYNNNYNGKEESKKLRNLLISKFELNDL